MMPYEIDSKSIASLFIHICTQPPPCMVTFKPDIWIDPYD